MTSLKKSSSVNIDKENKNPTNQNEKKSSKKNDSQVLHVRNVCDPWLLLDKLAKKSKKSVPLPSEKKFNNKLRNSESPGPVSESPISKKSLSPVGLTGEDRCYHHGHHHGHHHYHLSLSVNSSPCSPKSEHQAYPPIQFNEPIQIEKKKRRPYNNSWHFDSTTGPPATGTFFRSDSSFSQPTSTNNVNRETSLPRDFSSSRADVDNNWRLKEREEKTFSHHNKKSSEQHFYVNRPNKNEGCINWLKGCNAVSFEDAHCKVHCSGSIAAAPHCQPERQTSWSSSLGAPNRDSHTFTSEAIAKTQDSNLNSNSNLFQNLVETGVDIPREKLHAERNQKEKRGPWPATTGSHICFSEANCGTFEKETGEIKKRPFQIKQQVGGGDDHIRGCQSRKNLQRQTCVNEQLETNFEKKYGPCLKDELLEEVLAVLHFQSLNYRCKDWSQEIKSDIFGNLRLETKIVTVIPSAHQEPLNSLKSPSESALNSEAEKFWDDLD